jgi:Glycosyl transferase family 2
MSGAMPALADFLPRPGRGVGYKLGQDGALVQQGTLELLAFAQRPLVSCLMVTRGRLFPARFAVDCFRSQTWAARELVLVCDAPGTPVEAYCRELGDPRIRVVTPARPAGSLGELRNLSLRAAHGDWICQWDDDDLYHPQRLELGMLLLQAMQADAVFLSRWMLWSPAARKVGVSGAREWEGSMLARRAAVPPYPGLARGEDTAVMHQMLGRGRVALLDAPWLYTYVQTGANTWTARHFEAIWEAATMVEAAERYEAALAALEGQGPYSAYAAAARQQG